MAGDFSGKRALVLGVANKRSIAWAIAQELASGGARLAFTFQGERIEKSVRDRAQPVLASCEEHAQPVSACEASGDLGADPRRRAGDDRDPL